MKEHFINDLGAFKQEMDQEVKKTLNEVAELREQKKQLQSDLSGLLAFKAKVSCGCHTPIRDTADWHSLISVPRWSARARSCARDRYARSCEQDATACCQIWGTSQPPTGSARLISWPICKRHERSALIPLSCSPQKHIYTLKVLGVLFRAFSAL